MHEEFQTIYQNRIINELSRLSSGMATKDKFSGDHFIIGRHDLSIGGETWTSANMRVFDALLLEAVKNNGEYAFLYTSNFAELCGISKIVARRQMIQTADILNTIRNKEVSELFNCKSHRGSIFIEFKGAFMDSITGNSGKGVMPFPLQLFRIDLNKYPQAYKYGRIITARKFMNIGKTNENIIRVKDLCGAGYDSKTCGGYERKILLPLLKNMDALQDIFSYKWKGSPPLTYAEFLKATFIIEWKAYPDSFDYVANRRNKRKDTA